MIGSRVSFECKGAEGVVELFSNFDAVLKRKTSHNEGLSVR